jgi:hypothetical protein
VNTFLLQVSKLPETFTVRSSEGKVHCYLRKNGFEVRNQNFHPIGSLRADNFYCVGPESIHPDGHRYQVVKDVPVAELDPVLYGVLQQKAETMKRERENRFKNAPDDIIVRDGEGRHEFLTSRGSKLHNGEKDEDQLFVVGLHHSAKSSARDSYLSLENAACFSISGWQRLHLRPAPRTLIQRVVRGSEPVLGR